MIENPYRPGAGHQPPYLAGREDEQDLFRSSLRDDRLSDNLVVTGLRGVGKTVLVERLREIALEENWLWVGNDLSESSSLTEERLAIRVITDLASALGSEGVGQQAPEPRGFGFVPSGSLGAATDTFDALKAHYESVPGLPSDKLKEVLKRAGSMIDATGKRGLVFAYDEAQCLTDHAERDQFPMSMLVETFQALQKHEATSNFMLVLCGLPTLFDALTEARTYTERMFRVMTLERLNRRDTLAALLTPLAGLIPPLQPTRELVEKAADLTGGYPYLIQFFGKELVDALVLSGGAIEADAFPTPQVMNRLDQGLFAARWNRTTDRQRAFLRVIAEMDPAEDTVEFSANEIAAASAHLSTEPFTNAHARQMLQGLAERGMVYRTRHGRYAFTLPMTTTMILRRIEAQAVEDEWHTSSEGGSIDIEALMSAFGPEEPRSPAELVFQAPSASASARAHPPTAAESARPWNFDVMRPGGV